MLNPPIFRLMLDNALWCSFNILFRGLSDVADLERYLHMHIVDCGPRRTRYEKWLEFAENAERTSREKNLLFHVLIAIWQWSTRAESALIMINGQHAIVTESRAMDEPSLTPITRTPFDLWRHTRQLQDGGIIYWGRPFVMGLTGCLRG